MSIAFVAGATGFTGREVVRALVARSVRAVAHVRPDSGELDRWKEHFGNLGAEVDLTAFEAEPMAQTLGLLNPTHVFALLGTTRARMKRTGRAGGAESYESVDYGLTALLIRAAVASAPAARFVYLSAAGVNEKARSPYYRARWKTERALVDSGLSYTIVRPSFIVGPDRDENRPMERLAAVVFDRALRVAGVFGGSGLRDRWHSISNKDLAGELVRLALDPAAAHRVVESQELRGDAI